MRNRIKITAILLLVLLYGYQPSDKQEFITGFWYSKATETYPKEIPYPGNVKSFSVLF